MLKTILDQNYIEPKRIYVSRRITLYKGQIRFPEQRRIPLSGHLEICAGNIVIKISRSRSASIQFPPQEGLNKEMFFIEKYKPPPKRTHNLLTSLFYIHLYISISINSELHLCT